MFEKFNQAMEFAKIAHIHQKRKYTDEPYLCHPIAVAGLVFSVSKNDNMLAAAALHDVVEDTPTSIEEIQAAFGP
jgi:(p)ppGpp synthase/HD superfamily hydrolase